MRATRQLLMKGSKMSFSYLPEAALLSSECYTVKSTISSFDYKTYISEVAFFFSCLFGANVQAETALRLLPGFLGWVQHGTTWYQAGHLLSALWERCSEYYQNACIFCLLKLWLLRKFAFLNKDLNISYNMNAQNTEYWISVWNLNPYRLHFYYMTLV